MEYSQATADLLARMERAALRQEFVFDKAKITELVEKSYKLFGLKVPKIIWVVDVTDEKLLLGAAEAARAAGTARTARAARAAGAAGVGGAGGAARAAGAGGAARAATDYDGQEYIFSFEFAQTNKINDNDRKFLEAQELFLQLKEAGCGYWAEKNGELYVAPNPIIKLGERLEYHSEIGPAIEWKGGLKLYYLWGVNFPENLFVKLKEKTLTAKEALELENTEQRQIAIKKIGYEKTITELGGRIKSKDEYGELIEVEKLLDPQGKSRVFYKAFDPADNEYVYLETWPDIKTPQEAMTKAYRLELFNLAYNPVSRT